MSELSLLELLKSGAHFGHSTSRWNPKMKSYIYTVRNSIHVLDLEKTKQQLEKAGKYLTELGASGGSFVLVGTKRQAKSVITEIAQKYKIPHVSVRWLGGTFTNFKTIQKTIRKMEKLSEAIASPEFEQRYTKKERLKITREYEKLQKLFSGISEMKRIPEAIFVVDSKHEVIALKEAKISKVKTIGIVDSNSDPSLINFPIPCNDDSSKAISLVTEYLVSKYVEGRQRIVVTSTPSAPAATGSKSVETK